MDKTNGLMQNDTESRLFTIIRNILTELEAERAKLAISNNADLERDLGLGSIERAELLRRVETEFQIHVPETALTDVLTVNDLLLLIYKIKPSIALPLQQSYVPHLTASMIDPSKADTLVEILQKYAQYEPERPHIYLQNEEGSEKIIRYGQLFEMANALAEGMAARGIKAGETVALMLPTSEEFFYAFFAILLLGAVPVPIYPPFRADQLEEYAKREALILRNAEVRLLITFQQAEALSHILRHFVPSLIAVATTTELLATRIHLPTYSYQADDPALIQYTSGSTGNPKGVLLTHNNLLTNIRAFGSTAGIKASDAVVTWLPLYHDMGLIGTWLGSFYYGIPVTIMSPLLFLQHPERWLWAIHYHRATLSAGPNFAYELCLRKIDPKQIAGLDLSSWRLAFNGAEAIYPKTLVEFAKKFAPYGFKSEAFFPVYGLAESTVALTFPPVGRTPKIDRISRNAFETERKATPAAENDKTALEFVVCGSPLPEHKIRIVDEHNRVLSEREIGNIQFRGPSTMQGYYRNPEATAAINHEGWWDTGDLGYIVDNELVITGRKKDIIIKAGRNLYPAEIEEAVGQIAGVRKGCVAAFGIGDRLTGTEKLIVVVEIHKLNADMQTKLSSEINEKIMILIGMPADQILLVPPHTVLKTSSGKLRRSATREAYLDGKLMRASKSKWQQIIKLWWLGNQRRLFYGIEKLCKIAYTSYVGICLFVTVLPLFLISLILPQRAVAHLLRSWSKLILLMAGCIVRVTGKENLKKVKTAVYASNHSSYVDTLVLLGILPAGVMFVAKKELLKVPVLGFFIKKLSHLVVDRLDISQSINDTLQIQQVLEQGRSVAIFPEGTFTYATGLRTFKLGGFKVAVEAGCPIIPVTLQGTRLILRSGSGLMRPHSIKIHVSPPIFPQQKTWEEVVRMRSLVRLEIAKYCGEPTLDLIQAGYEKN